MKTFIFSVLLLVAASVQTVLAHTGLEHSSPADGETVERSLSELMLSFTRPVHLFKVTIEAAGGGAVDLGDYRTSEPGTRFVIDLPRLSPGGYVTNWTVMGGDGHKMSGSFQFTVSPD